VLDVYIHFLGAARATAKKLASEHEERCSHDDHEDHEYRYDCGVTATTIVISHKSILLYALMIPIWSAI
jgi:hypothetical protein